MTTIIVLFNLKPGISVDHYEPWARATDLPAVNGLEAVEKFEVLRSTGLLSGGAASPYQYVEVLRVRDVPALKADIRTTPAMKEVAAQFREFAEAPVFIVTEPL